MKRLPVLISLLILSATSHPASADTEFVDSVPLEVVKQFVGNPFRGEGTLYSDILDAFPPFTVPADFKVLASADQGYLQRVILSSTLDEEAASAALTAAFVAEGWMQVPNYGMPTQQTGFVSAEQPALQFQQLCHDDHGTVTVTVNAGTGTRYININRNIGPPGMALMQPGCAEMVGQATQNSTAMGFRGGNIVAPYAPKLLMPQSNTTPTPSMGFFGGGGGGSQNDWESRGTLALDWSINEIYAHFAEQIAEQGWATDSEATGAMVATGNWTKYIDDMDLVGTLSILKLADNVWELHFRLVRQGGAQRGAANGGVFIESTSIVRDTIIR